MDQGVSAQQVSLAIANSTEAEVDNVVNAYLTFLGRTASPAEIASHVNALSHGQTTDEFKAVFLGSAEFYAKARGPGRPPGTSH